MLTKLNAQSPFENDRREEIKNIDASFTNSMQIILIVMVSIKNTILNYVHQESIKALYLIALWFLIGCSHDETVNPNNSFTQPYGLGTYLNNEVSNNKSYDWYFDQGNSGTYSRINCGPAVAAMVAKWANKNFDGTPETARKKYRPDGGWWYTDDIMNYLNENVIASYTINIATFEAVKDKIDQGNIVILCLDMSYVSTEASTTCHVDRFYEASAAGWGHFIVVKGYMQVDGQTFYEAYDPYSFGSVYADNSIKGKNRYYRTSDLYKATNIWWPYAIVIGNGSISGGRVASDPNAVDSGAIPNKWGQ